MGWKEDERDFQRRGGTIIAALRLLVEKVEEEEEVVEAEETDRWRGQHQAATQAFCCRKFQATLVCLNGTTDHFQL